jgi:YHS domain-containing protein
MEVQVLRLMRNYPRRSEVWKNGIKKMTSDVCPVCGMKVYVDDLALTLIHSNQLYRFCSFVCLTAFAWRPELFVEEAGEPGNVVIEVPDQKKNFGKEVAS